MENTAKWYTSRTIWAQIVAVIWYGLTFTGIVNIDDTVKTQIVDAIIAVVTLASQVLAIYYRIKAEVKIVK